MKRKTIAFALLVISLPLIARSITRKGSERETLRTVSSVDLKRYTGQWYEIARLPNRFEKNCAGEVTANYTLRDDGRINVVNRCRKTNDNWQEAEGVARVVNKSTNAQLEVRFAPSFLSFLPFVWGDYWIVDLAPDYSYAAVGDPGRKYFWILARAPQMDDATYKDILERAAAQGFDINRVVKTRQMN
ncbi:MAG: lipocalin family protein [Pyrinomonadaceae bacterium]